MKSKATGCGLILTVFSCIVLLCVGSLIIIIIIIIIIIEIIIIIIIITIIIIILLLLTINKPVVCKCRAGFRRGIANRLVAGEALAGAISSDGVTIRTLVMIQA